MRGSQLVKCRPNMTSRGEGGAEGRKKFSPEWAALFPLADKKLFSPRRDEARRGHKKSGKISFFPSFTPLSPWDVFLNLLTSALPGRKEGRMEEGRTRAANDVTVHTWAAPGLPEGRSNLQFAKNPPRPRACMFGSSSLAAEARCYVCSVAGKKGRSEWKFLFQPPCSLRAWEHKRRRGKKGAGNGMCGRGVSRGAQRA